MAEYVKQEGAGIWIPEKEGYELIGEVVDVLTEGSYGTQWGIKKDDGEEIKTPSHKVLQNRMAKAVVGTELKIVHTGTEPPAIKGYNPTSMYDVFFKE